MDSSSSYPHDEGIDYKNSHDNCNDNDDDDEIHRMIERRNSDDSSSSSIVDSLVDVSKICNTWVVEYCTMCTNYMDKQVQYETTGIMSQYVNNAANKATSLLSRPAGTFDLQGSLAGYANCHGNTDNVRDMMFDEESVVESVISR
ncbi:hypothetical protein FRACYDRAFT_249500 [Fragilariopsis cylindrus CCMP1102]|uniref:Uncharacterized protein n=1 Tax=Fragilariopsis cylindrus CCMP1102 TaxID=635003 RepID=A0A1E7ERX8_9STRA|nr:hypothetical protein FRACYDRAFT_249500 [Fragilariopsis cylindrus CCMP1102]|eukprot:OEU08609.1 hypothetical protein FRACYDRAFT_249500 [Fragilariopsis cylindrus CCMP1102]